MSEQDMTKLIDNIRLVETARSPSTSSTGRLRLDVVVALAALVGIQS